MHLLATSSASLDDLVEPVDLGQSPGDIAVLSFTDSDLTAVATAWRALAGQPGETSGAGKAAAPPSLRLASLRELRHPLSVDLWIDKVGARAKVVVVRLLGGLDWWRYGAERLAAVARERQLALAVLPGDDRDDPRLAALSTLPAEELGRLTAYFREGGPANLAALMARLSTLAGLPRDAAPPAPLPRAGGYIPGARGGGPGAAVGGGTAVDLDTLAAGLPTGAPVVPVIFYRSMLNADDLAPVDALAAALHARGLAAAPLFVASLKEAESAAFVAAALARLQPAAIVTTTAFAAGDPGAATVLDAPGVPVFQAIVATTRREAWAESPRGLASADLAMHVVLPELDGRVLAGALGFKAPAAHDAALGFTGLVNGAEPDRVEAVADRVAAWVRLASKPPAERRVAVLMPDYAGPAGRAGYAVGLDVPQSVLRLLADLAAAGYGVAGLPTDAGAMMRALTGVGGDGASHCGDQAEQILSTAEASPPHQTHAEPPPLPTLPHQGGGFAPRFWKTGDINTHDENPPPSWGRVGRGGAAGEASARSGLDAAPVVAATGRDRLDLADDAPARLDVHPGTLDADVVTSLPSLPLADYARLFAALPSSARDAVTRAWGTPDADPDVAGGAFRFRALDLGNVVVALPPDRGRSLDRRADYHDPALPPRHALVAFGFWLRAAFRADALVHMGAHGTLEWLPGKAVALTAACFPEIVAGTLPVIYPFIASNPGEAAQAKRRLAAITLGHLPPPSASGRLSPELARLERLVDEFAAADGLDRRRRDRLAGLVVAATADAGLAAELGLADLAPAADVSRRPGGRAGGASSRPPGASVAGAASLDTNEAVRRIDAFLCDLKDLAIKDGLHVYGRAPADAPPEIAAAAAAERRALLDALAGRRIAAGPAGAPARGRADVLPTGRNLYTTDPRTIPTPTACDLGRLAADEVVRRHLQEHGDYPRAVVLDLWGSATLRTGGEEIAQGLVLMGCRPIWDGASGRVTGIEVLPPAALGRPRADVTFRISGLFRDLFPTQIALLDAAVRAVAARDEADDENPLAAAARAGGGTGGPALARVFGTAPGAYGTGVEDRLATGRYDGRAELGAAYLAAASYVYGAGEAGTAIPGAFAARVAAADLLVHGADDPGRDLLEGGADVAFLGGFAAAAASLGRTADLVVLDTSDPRRPRARGLAETLSRIVRGRATSPAFIAGQMRHGWRGAAELAETVDRLVAFAETTDAVSAALIDRLHAAYLLDPKVRGFLLQANPGAAATIARRLADARRRGLWHPRRNDVDADLAALAAEAAE